MDKVLSIVIPVYNKFPFTKSCLNDLFHLPNDHEIIIVDNGSIDNTRSELDNNKEIIYHRNEENLGFAKACNIGYNISSAPNVLFLNNDIRVKSNKDNWTNTLIDKCKDALVGPTMGQLDDKLNFVKEANCVLSGKSYMSGWCLASSKNIWNKLQVEYPREVGQTVTYIENSVEIFSEEFGLAYFEDTDLSFRARKLGINMEVVDVPVVHFGKQTSKQLDTHKLYNQARQIFVKKWNK